MLYKNYKYRGKHYLNFYFENIEYDDRVFMAHFRAPDDKVACDFIFDRETWDILINNNTKPVEEILPIPVYWLESKLEENGVLGERENKISI